MAELAAAEEAAAAEKERKAAEKTFNQAAALVKNLLDSAGIKRVVMVDDEIGGYPLEAVEAAVAASVAADTDAAVRAFPDIDFSQPAELWGPKVADAWDEWGVGERGDAAAVLGVDYERSEHAQALSDYLPKKKFAFELVPPEEWNKTTRAQVVEENQRVPSLVLFDSDMGRGRPTGEQLAAELFAVDSAQTVWAGLLTNTVALDQEQAVWSDLAKNPDIHADRFVVVSKSRLNDPLTFPHAIKLATMSSPSAALRDEVRVAVEKSVKHALDKIAKLSPDEFEYLVFRLSTEEGTWEPDVLVRLFNIHLRAGTLKRLHRSSRVQELAATLRALAAYKTVPLGPTDRARRTYRRELYERPTHLNESHLPIDLGDIFINDRDETFILVEQPCELMVRTDPKGRRAPDKEYVTLAKVTTEAPDEPGPNQFLLPVFTPTGEPAWVLFSRTFTVPVEALDYCVLNSDGSSMFDLSAPAPPNLWPSWTLRHRRLLAAGKVMKSKYDALTAAAVAFEEPLRKDLMTDLANAYLKITDGRHGLTGVVDGDTIRYNLTRTTRLMPAYARAMLSGFAAFRARDAFEFPLWEPTAEPEISSSTDGKGGTAASDPAARLIQPSVPTPAVESEPPADAPIDQASRPEEESATLEDKSSEAAKPSSHDSA